MDTWVRFQSGSCEILDEQGVTGSSFSPLTAGFSLSVSCRHGSMFIFIQNTTVTRRTSGRSLGTVASEAVFFRLPRYIVQAIRCCFSGFIELVDESVCFVAGFCHLFRLLPRLTPYLRFLELSWPDPVLELHICEAFCGAAMNSCIYWRCLEKGSVC